MDNLPGPSSESPVSEISSHDSHKRGPQKPSGLFTDAHRRFSYAGAHTVKPSRGCVLGQM